MVITSPRTLVPYTAPSFAARCFKNIPSKKLQLSNLPTPIHRIHRTDGGVLQPLWDLNIDLIVKRDDMTAGVELGGNKVRKLEFLLADAIERGYDTVVTIGGEQSNHCRATAAACRMVGLKPHLILRTKRANSVQKDAEENGVDSFGQVGNIMYDRLVGATVHMCTPGEYGRFGNKALVKKVAEELEEKYGSKVYQISVGGSSGLGTWGYIEGVQELKEQVNEQIDHIVFACGSGGTAAGITFGTGLAYNDDQKELNIRTPQLHAIGVCDSPEYFYNEVCLIGKEMGFDIGSTELPQTSMEDFVLDHLTVHQGKCNGYALSTPEELDFVCRLASETGIVLDPVYSGKALFQFIKIATENPNEYKNSTVMFWHTGGSLGMFDKESELSALINASSPINRMNLYG